MYNRIENRTETSDFFYLIDGIEISNLIVSSCFCDGFSARLALIIESIGKKGEQS